MGYFNIFYKITRIIDMLTRKRNRKAIMVILIIIAIVFIYHNKVNAQEDDLTYNQSFMHLRARLNTSGIVQYGSQAINGTWYYWHCNVFPVKEGFTYKGSCETAPSDAPLRVAFVSDLDNVVYQLQLENGSSLYDTSLVSYIGSYSSTSGFEYTAITDGFLIVGGFKDTSDYGWNDSGFKVYTNYNGQSNLNTINQDLLRIEDLLKNYLYGDVGEYDVTNIKTSNNKWFVRGAIESATGWSIFYFPNKKGHLYNFNWSYGNNSFDGDFKIAYSDSLDVGTTVNTIFNDDGDKTTTSFNFTSVSDKKYIIYYYYTNNNSIVYNVNVTSSYNYGQEYGLYGGLTDINNQTRQQGEQTRETISSTDYNQNVVSVDTSSVDSISSTQTQGLFTTIFNSFNSAATGGVDSIIIPLPHGNSITLYSNVVSSHLGSLSALISAFWYFVFGLYAFKFVNNLIRSIKTGDILNGFNSSNEVISKDIL